MRQEDGIREMRDQYLAHFNYGVVPSTDAQRTIIIDKARETFLTCNGGYLVEEMRRWAALPNLGGDYKPIEVAAALWRAAALLEEHRIREVDDVMLRADRLYGAYRWEKGEY